MSVLSFAGGISRNMVAIQPRYFEGDRSKIFMLVTGLTLGNAISNLHERGLVYVFGSTTLEWFWIG